MGLLCGVPLVVRLVGDLVGFALAGSVPITCHTYSLGNSIPRLADPYNVRRNEHSTLNSFMLNGSNLVRLYGCCYDRPLSEVSLCSALSFENCFS